MLVISLSQPELNFLASLSIDVVAGSLVLLSVPSIAANISEFSVVTAAADALAVAVVVASQSSVAAKLLVRVDSSVTLVTTVMTEFATSDISILTFCFDVVTPFFCSCCCKNPGDSRRFVIVDDPSTTVGDEGASYGVTVTVHVETVVGSLGSSDEVNRCGCSCSSCCCFDATIA